MRIVGIDPGTDCGLAAVDMNGSVQALRWVSSDVIHYPAGATSAERDRRFSGLINAAVERADPDVVVLEYPVDARAYWQVKTGMKRRESPETRFLQGKNYACSLLAVPSEVPVFAYPVKGRKGQAGWMGKTTNRVQLLGKLARIAATFGAPPDRSEHELMALGVLLHHLGIIHPIQRLVEAQSI